MSLAQMPLSCANFRLLRVITKKRDHFADIGLAVGKPAGFAPMKVCFKLSRWFGKRHKMDAFTKLGNLLSELNVPHKQRLTSISDAFSASLTSIWPSFLSCCLTSTEARWPIRDGDRVGRGPESERLDRGNRPKKTGQTADRRQNNGGVTAMSPRHCPATCALCNCSFNCCAGQSH